MEENVALDTSKQKQFVKSIKGIKKLIKKADVEEPEKVVSTVQDKKKSKRKRPERGLVYLSHIPHGFYENEMTQYFKQFGAVSNVRVIRSKRTGNSKGFAFVEFKQPAVAEIVADTMNNYLMGKRLIKAAIIPPEKQRHKAMRKHWSRLNNPGRTERLKQKKAYNENRDKAGELARAKKTFATYKKNMKKLSDIGINYDFFTPVDIPEELQESKDTVQKDGDGSKEAVIQNKDSKKQKKDKIKEPEAAPAKKESKKQKSVDPKKEKKAPEPVVNKKEQKQKEQKLKDAGVKLPENFVQIQQEGGDSDSSVDFDSDDYIKMLENDSESESDDDGDEQESDDDEENGSGDNGKSDEFEITGSDDDSEDEEIPSSKKGPIAMPTPVQSNKQAKQRNRKNKAPPQMKRGQKGSKDPVQHKGPKAPELGKRKASQNNVDSPKKPKYEKQTQKSTKKQFKKKK